MKKVLLGVGLLLLLATAAFAQGPFADVPTDHWAYDAVNELQEAGIVIGYPDGTFGGRRAMTRYEFAVAIARMIPVIEQRIIESGVTPSQPGVTQEQFKALEQRVTALEQKPAQTVSTVTPEQLQAIQRLVNEFRDEIAALGVDVDALKRDVASLAARVDALEKEVRRFRWEGDVNPFVVATSHDTRVPFDRDGRVLQLPGPAAGELINSVSFIRDADLKITGSLSPSFTVFSDISYGNYLPAYLGGVINDYVGTERTDQSRTPGPGFSNTDSFFPYYLYAEAGFGNGSLQVGRVPMQFTPYTLKLIDVDSYTVNDKLDSGDYPLDGGKLNWKLGSVGLTLVAAKTDQNSLLGPAGLVAQPTIALYDDSPDGITPTIVGAPFHAAGGHAAGGLDTTTQMAGARAVIGTPFKGNLGLTFLQVAGPVATDATEYDTVDIMGVDGRWQFGRFILAAEWAMTKTSGDAGAADIDEDNNAIDASLGFGLGKLGINVGWRSIENNFAAPGFWTKVGMWTNPTNIEGPYINLTYGIKSNLSLVANGAFYEGANAVATLPDVIDDTDDELWKADIGLRWGISGANSLNLGYEFVRWSPTDGDDTDETYLTIGWGYQINPSAGFNIGYQIIDYSPSGAIAPYGTADYKGAVAVAQFKARF